MWDECVELGEQFGYRNAQATVLAPTGTIGFMMDCDTTGVEPDIALVKYKKLVGGGMMKIVNQTVPTALQRLGYSQTADRRRSSSTSTRTRRSRARRTSRTRTCRCSTAPSSRAGPALDPLHGPHPDDGRRAAVPLGRHQQDRQRAQGRDRRGHPGGLHRVVAPGRQGRVDLPRRQQAHAAAQHLEGQRRGGRRRRPRRWSRASRSGAGCPTSAPSITHKFDIAGHEGYITVGLYEDGQPGEIFLVMAKEGSTISGFADAFAQAISYALQYGVPLQVLVDKFSHARFEPSGMTKNPEVRFAKSIVDYSSAGWRRSSCRPRPSTTPASTCRSRSRPPTKRLAQRRCRPGVGAAGRARQGGAGRAAFAAMQNQEDAPPCSTCGSIMVRSGACYKCANCGTTSGCA